MITRTAWFRGGLAVIFLITVLLASGYLAEYFRYPSLWGNRSKVFQEYSTLLPFGWALAHYLTMLPLFLLVSGLPTWDKSVVIKARWIVFLLFLACLVATYIYGNGRFHRIPFTLFFMVDLGTFLLISLCFHPPYRLLAAVATLILLTTLATALWPVVTEFRHSAPAKEKPVPDEQKEPDLLTPADMVLDQARKIARYYLYVGPTVTRQSSRLEKEICNAAEGLLIQMKREQPAPKGFETEAILMANPDFEPKKSIFWNYGTASFVNGNWHCTIEFPTPPDNARSGDQTNPSPITGSELNKQAIASFRDNTLSFKTSNLTQLATRSLLN